MSLVLNGSGSITGLSAGGLPDGSVTADDIASTLDLSGKTITNMNPSGIYLGGTGAANYLDDYETGTWTPTATDGSLSYQKTTYIKIGSAVHVSGLIEGFTSSSGIAMEVSGLPFTSASNQLSAGSLFFRYVNHSHDQLSLYMPSSSNIFQMWSSNKDGAYAHVLYSQLQSGHTIFFQLTYYTDA